MEIVYKNINDVIPYEKNPRVNKKAVDYVANSIKKFGFKNPIIIDKNNVIVAGHTRLKASKKLGLKDVPCIIADDLDENQIKAFRLADNKVAEIAEWDNSLLDLEVLELKDKFNFGDFGFDVIDELVEEQKAKENKKYLESMDIKAFEHHDYVVFVFDNQMDWLNIVNEFGIKKVDSGYGAIKKVGVGRVINGKRLLEKLGH